jgi:hypothetical protein
MHKQCTYVNINDEIYLRYGFNYFNKEIVQELQAYEIRRPLTSLFLNKLYIFIF